MSIANLFEKIAGRQKQREKSRVNDFRGLVKSIVAGKEPDPDFVDDVLAATGKTLDDLKSAVELHQKRIALKAQLDAVPKLEAEKAKLEEQMRKAREVLEAAEKKYEEAAAPLRFRLGQIRSEVEQTYGLPHELEKTCPYEELIERVKQADREFSETHKERAELEAKIKEQKRIIAALREETEDDRRRHRRQENLDAAEHRSARLKEMEAELVAVLKRIDDSEKLQAATRLEMQLP